MTTKLPSKLQQVVDRFVDDLMEAIWDVAREELIRAARGGPSAAPLPRPAAQRAAKTRARGRGSKKRKVRPARGADALHAVEQVEHVAVPGAEITDPHALLDAALPAAMLRDDPPEADVAPAAAAVVASSAPRSSLRANEAVLRRSSAGLVIRRVR